MLSEIMTDRLLAMLDNELEEVDKGIRNNSVWRDGSDTPEEAAMFENNILDLLDYKDVLLNLRERTVEGDI